MQTILNLTVLFYSRMVRNYKRKTMRQNWPEESMRCAIKMVIEERKSISCAANEFNLPYATLYDKIKKMKTQNLNYNTEKLTGKYNMTKS